MMCGMCEAHVNEAIRGAFPVKKVTSSHTKGETVILTDAEIDEDKLKETVAETGYTVLGIEKEPYEKKGFFARRK
jgi:copper chaperone CopZ